METRQVQHQVKRAWNFQSLLRRSINNQKTRYYYITKIRNIYSPWHYSQAPYQLWGPCLIQSLTKNIYTTTGCGILTDLLCAATYINVCTS